MYDQITVQQPEPFDLVAGTVLVAGRGTGFEATVSARVRNADGDELVADSFMAGTGTGAIGSFQTQLALPGRPSTPAGFVEVFQDNPGFPEEGGPPEVHKVAVPVVFGTNLVADYRGYTLHVVREGETLSAIADDAYGDPGRWPRIFEANRNQVGDADVIFPGQVLRIPR